MNLFQLISLGLIIIFINAWAFALIINLFSKRACGYEAKSLNNSPAAGAIIIFGAKVIQNAPSKELKSRLDLALKIWSKTSKPFFALSGGVDKDSDEPATMRRYLISNGVPEESILVLKSSFNTRETLISFSQISKDLPLIHSLAISSPYHALRIRIEAKRMNIPLHIASDLKSPENNNRWVFIIRTITEIFAIAFYMFPHKITKRIPTSSTSLRHKIPSHLIKLGA